jgi:hypothetical protein
MPALERLARRTDESDTVVLGINTADSAEAALRFLAEVGTSYTVLLDAGEVARGYGATALPTLVVIDREGTILARESALLDDAALERLLQGAGARLTPG